MLRVLIIDDEKYSLEFLSQELQGFDVITIIGKFQDATKAIEFIKSNPVDAVFVDIQMPKLSGMDFLSYMNQHYPSIKVIFTTAYSHHTLDAFKLGAFDYIMKPVLKDRLSITLKRLLKELHLQKIATTNMVIKVFGEFSISFEGQAIKWRTTKAKELVAYLLLREGKKIHQDQLIDDLWHNDSKDITMNYLYSIVYYARKTFKNIGLDHVISYSNNFYSLKLPESSYDLDLSHFTDFCTSTPFFTFNALNIDEAIYTASLYVGDLYQINDYGWCLELRSTLNTQYESLLYHIAHYYYKLNTLDLSYKYIRLLIEHNPFNDEAHLLMLTIYEDTNDQQGYNLYLKQTKSLYLKELGIAFKGK